MVTSTFEDQPLPRFDRVLGFFSYPCLYMVVGLVSVVVMQAFIPAPRIGVYVLWESSIRLIVGLVAITPVLLETAFHTRRCCRSNRGPTVAARPLLLSAIVGAILALVVSNSLGGTLTPFFAIVAVLGTVAWIFATGIVSVYLASEVWRFRLARRGSHPASVSFLAPVSRNIA
jgi:hypothetical protein